ncbi:unnamed protein product [Acanthoscelides obtectus]|uniref:Uncharacterized protein n=1 Tax=Acanthoscelides obtectus TaxID=200917 RepID=A0A9P0PE86_ACAOB|nr:unnamed protein product [Acanthoscelides obtectus]CAK1672096.1 hypothetical protein AOBTE_LOCUS28644 [Acanthoscelides obtectus]
MDFSSVLNADHREILHNMLATDDGFEGIVLSSEPLSNGFSTVIPLNICSKEEAFRWLGLFQEKSKISFRVKRCHAENTQKIIFKKEYHCIHNTKPKRNF